MSMLSLLVLLIGSAGVEVAAASEDLLSQPVQARSWISPGAVVLACVKLCVFWALAQLILRTLLLGAGSSSSNRGAFLADRQVRWRTASSRRDSGAVLPLSGRGSRDAEPSSIVSDATITLKALSVRLEAGLPAHWPFSRITAASLQGAGRRYLLDGLLHLALDAAVVAVTLLGLGTTVFLILRAGKIVLGISASRNGTAEATRQHMRRSLQGEAHGKSGLAHIIPLVPGLTVPISHLPIIIGAVFLAQWVHEVYGHALAALYLCKTSSSISPTRPSSASSTSALHRATSLGVLLPAPGIVALAYVRLPAFSTLRARYGLSTRALHRVLAAGIGANILSLLLILFLLGPASAPERSDSSLFPSAGGPLLAASSRLRIAPSLDLGTRFLRPLFWNDDPLGTALSGSGSPLHGGLRIVKLDAAVPSALAQELQADDVLLGVDDVSLLRPPEGAKEQRVAKWQAHLSRDGDERAERGWCLEHAVWDALPGADCAAAASTDPAAEGVCFSLLHRSGEAETAVDSRMADPGKLMQSTTRRCASVSDCGRTAVCARPSDASRLVRLVVLDRATSTASSQRGSTTLFLSLHRTTLLASLTVSPLSLRAPLGWVVPSFLADGWLMLLDLALRYWLLASVGIVVLNSLPLPGLDADQMLQLALVGGMAGADKGRRADAGANGHDSSAGPAGDATKDSYRYRMSHRALQVVLVACIVVNLVGQS